MADRPPRTPAGRELAEAVRLACLGAARAAYEDAGIRGLCPEGRWEAALDAVASLDLAALLSPPGGPTEN